MFAACITRVFVLLLLLFIYIIIIATGYITTREKCSTGFSHTLY